MATSSWRVIGRYRLCPEVRVVVQVGDRAPDTPDDKVAELVETGTTLAKLARVLARLMKEKEQA